jgi:hypothetical protein
VPGAPVQTSIWLPQKGDTNFAALRVDKAVREYDDQLSFGQNNDTGDWCIFLIRRGEAPLPVIGFGREIPHPDDAIKRLYRADAKRRGHEILDEINRSNAELERARDEAAAEGEARLAEVAEWALRTEGKTSHKKVVMGKGRERGGLTQ